MYLLHLILVGQFVIVDVIYTYCRFKSNFAVVHHIKGAYTGVKLLYIWWCIHHRLYTPTL